MILAVFALLSMSLNAQQTVTVGNGTSTSNYLPVYGWYYDFSQQNQLIYTAADLGLAAGTQITSMTFYTSNGIHFSGGSVSVKLGTTTETNWSTDAYGSASPITGVTLTQVANITSFTTNSNYEWTINFSSPFTYTGDNLLVQFDCTAGTCDPSSSGTNSTLFYGNTSHYSYNGYGSSSKYRRQFQPKATFTYTASTTPIIIASPTSVSLSSIPGGSTSQTINVEGFNLTGGITATISGTDASVFGVSPASLGTSGGSLTVTYSPTAVGNHTATLTLSSTGAQDVTIPINGTCSTDLTVYDGTDQDDYLPLYGYYYDNKQVNQMIYPASALSSIAGKNITSMTFYSPHIYFSGGKYTVKVGETNQTAFSSMVRNTADLTAIVVSDTAATAGGTELTITFRTPFTYNGGNLLLDFEVTTNGSYGSNHTYFYGVNQSTNTGFNTHGNSSATVNSDGVYTGTYSGLRQFLPKVTFTVEDNTPVHDLGITLSEPTAVLAGENATITATVTNHGNQTENGYTVTFSDGTNTFSTQTGGELAPNGTATFTATYTTSTAGTVSITANVACTGDADATNDEATTNLTVNAPVHDLGIALAVNPTSVEAGDNATLTATVTNNGNQTESGYTVTFSDGTTTFSTQTGGTLAPGATETFTATYTTTNQMGTSVTITANVACTGDADATNDDATVSLNIISMPPPENVQATGGELSGTMTWDAPSDLPTTPVTEDFEDTSVFPPFEAGGVTATTHTGAFGDWTLYDATGGCITYGSKQLDYDNEGEPHAWFVFKPSESTPSEDYPDAVPHAVHSGAQYLESICPRSSTTAAGVSDHWLISPELSGLAQTISFYVCELVTDYGAETYEIWVSTTDNDPSSFTKLGSTYTVNYTNWTEQTVQLAAGTKYFAIRHTSNDIFGLLIDDVTYQVPMEPESYNIYLDGVLVDNVNSDVFNYTFNNVSTGEHQCAVSAVYPNGKESVAVPATFTSTLTPTLAISPATQTINDATAGTVTVTGTNVEGNISVSAGNDWSLNPTSLSSNGGNVNVTYEGRELSASTTVTASATGASDATATVNYVADVYIVTDNGQTGNWDFTNGTSMSYNDGIYTATFTANADNTYILFARMLGNEVDWNTRYVFGPDSNSDWWLTGDSGSGNLDLNDDDPIKIVNAGTYTVTIDANNGTFSIERVPEGQTATPTITYTVSDDYVTITATGDGTVTLNVPGYDSASGEGSVSIIVPRGYVSNTINVTATAKESGKTESETETAQITIPAGSDWIQMDGTYSATDLLSFQKDGEDIMLIDQFLASTLNNDHPDHYTYTLRQTVNGETQTSTPVTIPVYKTNSSLQGLYTKGQVDTLDTNMSLKNNVLNTKMNYDVVPDRNTIYYSLYRGDMDDTYPEITADQRISQLQRFEEMIGDQPQYFMFESHQAGITPRYDHLGNQIAERLDTNWVEATYNKQLAYVPAIWTSGLNTARGDGKNNSYGSDIKREIMGDLAISISGERTNNNAYGTWKVNGVDYCAYHPEIEVTAILPNDGQPVNYNDGDIAEYEPYMCRAWCTYEGIRDFGRDGDGNLTDLGELTVPYLLGDAYFGENSKATIGGSWTGGAVRDQWSFGVPNGLNPNEVTFVVRFYYKKKVTEAPAQNNGKNKLTLGNGQNEEYFIVQAEGNAKDIPVALNELLNGPVPVSVTYVNPQGMQSSKPFDGINIVVTRYSDGTTRTTKVAR